MSCRVDTCERPVDHPTVGLCDTHYRRHLRGQDLTTPIKPYTHNPPSVCQLDFCDKPYYAGGYCSTHYHRNKATGDPGGPIVLKVRAIPFRVGARQELHDLADVAWAYSGDELLTMSAYTTADGLYRALVREGCDAEAIAKVEPVMRRERNGWARDRNRRRRVLP